MASTGGYNSGCGNEPQTCAQWRAQRNAGTLEPGCPIIANDITWVLAGGTGEFKTTPTDENSLPEDGWYESPALNPGQPWAARIDWDTCQIYWMHDASYNENEVHGNNEVRNFPWGNNQVQRNHIEQASLTYTGGTLRDSYLGPASNTVISGGNVDEARVEHDGNLSVSGGNFYESNVSANSNVTQSGGTIDKTTICGDSTVSMVSGRILESRIDGSSTVLVDGSNCDQADVSGAAYIDLRGHTGNFSRNKVHRGRIYLGGTQGNVTDSSWDTLGYLYARNCTGLNWQYLVNNGYGYAIIDGSAGWRPSHVGLRDVSYIYGRNSNNVTGTRWTGVNQGVFDLDDADGVVLQYAKAENSATLRLERATGRVRYIEVVNRGYFNGTEFPADWYDISIRNQSTFTAVRATRALCYKIVLDNQSSYNGTDSNSLVRRLHLSANSWDDRTGNNQIVDCNFSQGACFTRDGEGEYYDCGGKAYPYLNGIGAPQGRATRVYLDSNGRFRCLNADAGWRCVDCDIHAQSDLRIESAGLVQRSSLSARAILTARQPGTIDRAVLMQLSTTQTVNSTNLRLHAGGAF